MKNIIKSLFTIALAAFTVVSCAQKEHAEGLRVTYYPDIVLKEGSSVNWPIGQPWIDPGYTATLNGEDVTNDIVVSNPPDIEVPGAYKVNYSLKNPDGFSSSISRTVYVCDPSVTLDISGTFSIDPEQSTSNGKTFSELAASRKASQPDYAPYVSTSYTISFKKIAPGFFYCEDLMGGWYKYIQGRGGYYKAQYGNSYFTYFDMTGHILLDNEGNISLVDSEIGAWGDSLDSLEGKYDKDTKTLAYNWSYADGQVVASPVMIKD